MCNFLSAIVTKNCDIYCDPSSTDSHEDLIEYHGFKDNLLNNFRQSFARIEFVPSNYKQIANLSTWELILDENNTPDWWKEKKDTIREKLEALVSKHIVTDERKLLLGNWYILVGEAKVDKVKSAVIKMMLDNSQVNEMHGNSQVNEMRDNSQVNVMQDNSQVNVMYSNSQVNVMWDNSQVNRMYGNSQVNVMWNNSQVNEMYSNSQVNGMYHNSLIKIQNSSIGVIKDRREK